MPVSQKDLTPYDYNILEYINRFESVSYDRIEKRFKRRIKTIRQRIYSLAEYSFESNVSSPYPAKKNNLITLEGNFGEFDEISETHFKNAYYHISPLGKKALEDYRLNKLLEFRRFWSHSILTPILVSVVTTLLVYWLTSLLL